MIRFFHLFWTRLRLSKPWKYKAPLLMAVPYCVYQLSIENNSDAIFYVALSLITIIGIAGFGYLTNDLGDREKDALAGKENGLTDVSKGGIVGLFLFFLVLALFPWFIFPTTYISFSLLGLQLFLFVAYAFPPFRLKEKGLVGVFVDALYAHVLPAVLAGYTFSLIAHVQDIVVLRFLIWFCVWQGFLGVRNILLHQANDSASDAASSTKTFARSIGIAKAEKLIKAVVILEVITFLAFAFAYARELPVLLFGFVIFIAWRWWNWFNEGKEERQRGLRFYLHYYLDAYYFQYIPVLLLLLLIPTSRAFFPVLVVHLILFPNFLKLAFFHFLKRILGWLPLKLYHLISGKPLGFSLLLHGFIAVGYCIGLYRLGYAVFPDPSPYIKEMVHQKSIIFLGLLLIVHGLLFLWMRKERLKMSAQKNILALGCNAIDQYSETFIRNQISQMQPKLIAFGGGYLPHQYSTDRGGNWEALSTNLVTSLKNQKVSAALVNYGPGGVAWMPSCKKLKLPLYVHFHGFDAYRKDVLDHYGKDYPALFQYAKGIIVVSEEMKTQLLHLGCPESKLHHIPCGIDTYKFVCGENNHESTFISTGRFVEKKAPQLTLEAFKRVHAKHSNSKLKMIGDGPLLEACKKLVKDWGMNDAVQFEGVLTPDEVRNALQKASVFVQQGVVAKNGDREGTPTSIMEAGACGLPVVASRHAGILHVIIDGETGFLVPEGDANAMAEKMELLLLDKVLRKEMGSAARKRVATHFNLKGYLAQLEKLIFES